MNRLTPIIAFFSMFSMIGPLIGAEPDPKAVQIADRVMEAMGGQEAYDQTRHITWRFFGRRLHVWDKWTGNIRVEDGQGMVVLMNLSTGEGKAWQEGNPIEEAGELKKALKTGYEAWINDSYWLVMPYKLKDPGVNLVYSGEGTTEAGRSAHILTLTFENVGVTPENKYEVLVDQESYLVSQWNFFTKFDDPEPRFKTPWANWQKFGKILLSDDRGRFKHTDIGVSETLPESVYTHPDPVSFSPTGSDEE